MSRPLRIEFPRAVYHVTSRGNERRDIFYEDADISLLLAILGKTIDRWSWICHAYCLMNNHYHLLIETPGANLSRGMRQLNGVYTQAINRRRQRCGHLFQGRFKAMVVQKETHLLEVCRYVVLNPVRAKGMKIKSPEGWQWSSYRATVGLEEPIRWLSTKWTLSRFGKSLSDCRKGYRDFVMAGIGQKKPFEERGGLWIGGEKFGSFLKELVKGKEEVCEHPRMQRLIQREDLDEYLRSDMYENLDSRNNAIFRAYTRGRFTQAQIAAYLGLTYVTISRIITAKEKEIAIRMKRA